MGPARNRRSLAPRWPLALADAPRAPIWLARFLEASGGWLFLVWLLVSGWTLTADPRVSGVLLAAWLVARPALLWLARRWPAAASPWLATTVLVGRAAIALVAVLVASGRLELLLLAALAFGGLTALADAARPALLGRLFGGSAISAAGSFDALIGRLAFVAGPVTATVLLLILPALAAWTAGAALLGAALILLLLVGWERRTSPLRTTFAPGTEAIVEATPPPRTPAANGFRALDQPSAATYLAAALAAGALTVALTASLPHLITTRAGIDAAFLGAALGLVGLGGMALRIPVVRLRPRLPSALVVAVVVWGLALAVALIGALGALVVGVPLLLIVGSVAVALDAELLVQLRRAGDGASVGLRWLVTTVALGQLAGALKIALLGPEPAVVGGPLVTIALASSALMAAALIYDRRSLFALRHQVQEFSWNADPPPRPLEPAAPHTRGARLAGWIHRRIETELVDVTLPVSGRHYAIARPSGEGRDSLFEAAKADAERQMPYWAKVWPSGVALADIVVERAAEVSGRQVLELGAGLGVTACAVLEEGGQLITADYSLLPLALCRLNGLLNTGRAAGSICFNWRDEEQVREVLHRHPPIGLILAADVLYEGRDVLPLVQVIERLLAPDGALWLAEPVRRTAGRFLDTVATLGWQVDSRRIQADWADATNGWVNVHVIRREREPAEAAIGLGGWQL